MKRHTLLIFWLLWLVPALCLAGESLLLDCAYQEDATGKLSIDAVAQGSFQPSSTLINRGYGESAHWLRLRLRPAQPGSAVVLRIRPATLDDLQLFEPAPDQPGGWKLHRLGQGVAEDFVIGDPAPSIIVHPEAQGTLYYLRVLTPDSALMQFEVLTVAEAHAKSVRGQLKITAMLTFIAAFAAILIGIWRHKSKLILAAFCLFQLLSACYLLVENGYFVVLFPAGGSLLSIFHLVIYFISMTVGGMILPFAVRHLFHMRCPERLFSLPLFFPPFVLLLVFILPLHQVYYAATLSAMLLNCFFLALAVWGDVPEMRWWPVLRIFMLVAAPIGIYIEGARLAYWPAVAFMVETPVVRGVLRALFWSIWAYEIHKKWLVKQQATQAQLNQVTEQWHEEKERSETQASLIALLSHELKTPLAVVGMAFDLGQSSARSGDFARRALGDMSALIDRCRQVVLLDSPDFRPQREACDLASLIDEAVAGCPVPERLVLQREDTPLIHTDRVMVLSIVRNLLDNACKYGAQAASIHLTQQPMAQQGRPGVAIRVSNQVGGAGMPDPAMLFSKAYRSPGARKHSGSGLGLFLSRGFAEKLSGSLEFTCEDTTVSFTLWLPH